MNEPRTLGPWLRRFLAEHIVTERNLARNTQLSYRDTFVLLIPFVSARVRKPADRLAVDDLTSRRVLEFLAHLEDELLTVFGKRVIVGGIARFLV